MANRSSGTNDSFNIDPVLFNRASDSIAQTPEILADIKTKIDNLIFAQNPGNSNETKKKKYELILKYKGNLTYLKNDYILNWNNNINIINEAIVQTLNNLITLDSSFAMAYGHDISEFGSDTKPITKYNTFTELNAESDELTKQIDELQIKIEVCNNPKEEAALKSQQEILIKKREELDANMMDILDELELHHEKDEQWKDLGNALSDTGAAFKNAFTSLFNGEGFEGFKEAFKQTGATLFVLTGDLTNGVLKVGEKLGDGVVYLFSEATYYALKAQGNEAEAESFLNDSLDFIRKDQVDKLKTGFYENTELGRQINEDSNLKYDSDGSNFIQNSGVKITEIAAAAAATYFTGGAAAPIILGFIEGTGEGAEIATQRYDRENGEEYNLKDINKEAIKKGFGKAAEWYGYGEMGAGIMKALSSTGSTVASSGLSNASTSFMKNFKKNILTLDTVFDTGSVVVDHGLDFACGDISFKEFIQQAGPELLFAISLDFFSAGLTSSKETKQAKKLFANNTDVILKNIDDIPSIKIDMPDKVGKSFDPELEARQSKIWKRIEEIKLSPPEYIGSHSLDINPIDIVDINDLTEEMIDSLKGYDYSIKLNGKLLSPLQLNSYLTTGTLATLDANHKIISNGEMIYNKYGYESPEMDQLRGIILSADGFYDSKTNVYSDLDGWCSKLKNKQYMKQHNITKDDIRYALGIQLSDADKGITGIFELPKTEKLDAKRLNIYQQIKEGNSLGQDFFNIKIDDLDDLSIDLVNKIQNPNIKFFDINGTYTKDEMLELLYNKRNNIRQTINPKQREIINFCNERSELGLKTKIKLNTSNEINFTTIDQINRLDLLEVEIAGGFRQTTEDFSFIDVHTYNGYEIKSIISRLEELESQVDMNLSPTKRAAQLYDIIADNYNYTTLDYYQEYIYNVTAGLKGITPVNALGEEGLVCAGFSDLYYELANRCDIKCEFVIGEHIENDVSVGRHAWNIVFGDNGKMIPVDVTNAPNAGNYCWFGQSEAFAKTHKAFEDKCLHTNGLVTDYCSDSVYDRLNAFLEGYDTKYGDGQGLYDLKNAVSSGKINHKLDNYIGLEKNGKLIKTLGEEFIVDYISDYDTVTNTFDEIRKFADNNPDFHGNSRDYAFKVLAAVNHNPQDNMIYVPNSNNARTNLGRIRKNNLPNIISYLLRSEK